MPNPARDVVRFMLPEKEAKVRVTVYGADGREVFSRQLIPAHNLCKLQLQNLKNGLYFLVVKGTKNNYSGRFVVMR